MACGLHGQNKTTERGADTPSLLKVCAAPSRVQARKLTLTSKRFRYSGFQNSILRGEGEMKQSEDGTKKTVNRRSFLKRGAMVAGGAAAGAMLLSKPLPAFGQSQREDERPLTQGDIAILRFVAAAELIESDLWIQYAELGGIGNNPPVEVDPTQPMNNYQLALSNLDGDASQYISSNTLDEVSHASFLNAYLESKGAEPVNFDRFHTLQGSRATGAQNIGRLTNLMRLNVDTSWYVRYRSTTNPDFGATFPQALQLNGVTAIPRTDADFDGAPFPGGNPNGLGGNLHIQAIANVAAFHFGYIEQGGSSLYQALGRKVSHLQVLKIMFGIGGDEVAHFLEWVDFAGNGVQGPVAPFTDPTNGLTFPDFNATGNPLLQTNLIFPVPCEFISPSLPHCAVIRPTEPDGIAAGAVKAFTDDGLFIGQPVEFFDTLAALAEAADEAKRDS